MEEVNLDRKDVEQSQKPASKTPKILKINGKKIYLKDTKITDSTKIVKAKA